jgi:hypothetical protein
LIVGNKNTLDHITIQNSTVNCLCVRGNFNKVSNIGFTLASRGCKVIGNENFLSSLTMTDVIQGIHIYSGDKNSVHDINYNATMSQSQLFEKLKQILNQNVVDNKPKYGIVSIRKGKSNLISGIMINNCGIESKKRE